MAVELYQVIKKSMNNEDLDEEKELNDIWLDTQDADAINEEVNDENTYNDKNEAEEKEEGSSEEGEGPDSEVLWRGKWHEYEGQDWS